MLEEANEALLAANIDNVKGHRSAQQNAYALFVFFSERSSFAAVEVVARQLSRNCFDPLSILIIF